MLKIIRKILKLLTVSERKKFYLLFGVMAISGLIEVAGIASIMPFLSLITNPDLIQDNRILNWLYTALNFQSFNSFLIFTGFIVLVILILSNVMVFLTLWGLLRFTQMRDYTISKRLLSRYLYQPYIFFLNQNTSTLGKNILSEVGQAIGGVMVPLMESFARGIVALFIFAMLIAVDPLLALAVIIILGGAYISIYKLVQKKLYYIGKRRFQTNTERFKAVNEAFGGIKQIKLLGCEKVFIKGYSKPSFENAKHRTTSQIISHIPRYIMEIIAFGGIIVVVIYLLATKKGFQEFLPLIGLYAFAAYRLMPALQVIFKGFTQVRFNIHALEALYKDMHSFKDEAYLSSSYKKKSKPLLLKKEIRLEGIKFSYPGTSKHVIDDLNVKINANTSIAFVGETGAGKTTIADLILGLLRPNKGKIFIDDIEINEKNLPRWQQNLGYIPQDIYLQDDTVVRNIAFGVPESKIDMASVRRSAKVAKIHSFVVNELPNKYSTVIGERGIRLSGGQRQRIGIARALYHNPEVLVLDEATSALDGVTEKSVFAAIHSIARTKTLIIIAHRLTTIQDCDVVYLLESGAIIAKGKYDELIDSNEKFSKMARIHM